MRNTASLYRTTGYPDRDALVDAVYTAGVLPDEEALMMVGRFSGFRALDRIVLLHRFPHVSDLCRLDQAQVENIIRRPLRRSKWAPNTLLREIERDRTWQKRGSDRFMLWIGSPEYPERLRRVYDAPAILYGWGNRDVTNESARDEYFVSVIGTRKPDHDGLTGAYTLGRDLSRKGIHVVSGLARGIDGAAHRGCVAEGDKAAFAPPQTDISQRFGKAVVVLGSGIDDIYPREHRPLAFDILNREGVLLSEYPAGFSPRKFYFPARNRIIAGLSDAVVVVQAPEGSGSLITADFAGDIGVDVLVHDVGRGWTGGEALINGGAPVVENARDLAKLTGIWGSAAALSSAGGAEVYGEEPTADSLNHPALAAFGPPDEATSLSGSREQFRRIGATLMGGAIR